MKMSSTKNSIILFTAVIIGVIIITFSSYSVYKRIASNEAEISIAKFQIKINNSDSIVQNIALKDTITTNNYSDDEVVPGTNGAFDLSIDFSNVEVSSNYAINFDRTNIPNNLKLYSDSNYTNEITSINDSYNIGDSTNKTITVYWKWNYLNDNVSNENDNLYMNQEISLPTSITITQIVGGGN